MKISIKIYKILSLIRIKLIAILGMLFFFNESLAQTGSYFKSNDISITGGAFTPYVRIAGNLMITIGAIVFLYAAIITYNAWQAGQQGIFGRVQNMLLGSFALLATGTVIYGIFNI